MSAATAESRFHPVLRAVAALLVVTLMGSCTVSETRAPIDAKQVGVDWSKLPSQTLDVDGISLQGILLTPSQWPLEGSMSRLFHGDMSGFISEFNLSFQPSTIPDGVLSDLYNAGYVPAYVRMGNGTGSARPFDLSHVGVTVGSGMMLATAAPEELPSQFQRTSGRPVAQGVGVALAIVVVVVGVLTLMPSNKIDNAANGIMNAPVFSGPPEKERRPDDGLIRNVTLAPGERTEGLVFFHRSENSVDWKTAKLIAH